jgi:hypothetical protein
MFDERPDQMQLLSEHLTRIESGFRSLDHRRPLFFSQVHCVNCRGVLGLDSRRAVSASATVFGTLS